MVFKKENVIQYEIIAVSPNIYIIKAHYGDSTSNFIPELIYKLHERNISKKLIMNKWVEPACARRWSTMFAAKNFIFSLNKHRGRKGWSYNRRQLIETEYSA